MTEALGGMFTAALLLCATAVPGLASSVTVEPRTVPVGGVALVRTDVRAASGTFAGERLRFFPVAGGRSAALVGIDLDRRPGRYPIEIDDRRGLPLRTDLEVEAREFPEERLTVPKTFTEPDAATLARISREQRLLAALWTTSSAERYWREAFVRPTEGPAGSPFGLRRFFNGEPRSPHAGIDFRAPEGSPVHASNRGYVVLARELFFTGNTVVVDHGCGLFTLYVHLSKLSVRRGALVERGQEIGAVGMTGRATGPHLHFAARIGEARVDPQAILERNFD
jgi:murein DD-endopeptidase MepM/ murein hydrolase activator NlpD